MTTNPGPRPTQDDLVAAFAERAHRLPLSESTVRTYIYGVRKFADWLAEQTKHSYDDVVRDETAATHAVRDFRRHLLATDKRSPKTVDSALSGISALYNWWGMPRPDVRMASGQAPREPQALTEEQSRDVLRAAERRGVRDHALIMALYAAGPRVSEASALDADDVSLSERRGLMIVRAGKGDKYREIELNQQAVAVLGKWVRARHAEGHPEHSGPLWVSRGGGRLAVRSIAHTVHRVGAAAGIPHLHPHTLRHTFGTRMARQGVDVQTIADLMGHASVETAMVYTRSNRTDRAAAVRHLEIDY